MLTSIEVESPGARTILQLPLEENEDPLQRNDYYILDVSGLDPVKASFASTNIAHGDGSYIQSSRLDIRNIVLTLGMNPDFADNSVQSLRTNLYRYFMPKEKISLKFIDSDFVAKVISGYVESVEAPIFTKDPRLTVSILCPNPIFSSVEDSVITSTTTANSDRITYENLGTSPSGFIFRANTGTLDLNSFRIEVQSEYGNIQSFMYNAHTEPQQAIQVDTRLKHRSVLVYTGNKAESKLYNVDVDSVWPVIYPGTNLIRVYSVNTGVPYTITFNESYGGL